MQSLIKFPEEKGQFQNKNIPEDIPEDISDVGTPPI